MRRESSRFLRALIIVILWISTAYSPLPDEASWNSLGTFRKRISVSSVDHHRLTRDAGICLGKNFSEPGKTDDIFVSPQIIIFNLNRTIKNDSDVRDRSSGMTDRCSFFICFCKVLHAIQKFLVSSGEQPWKSVVLEIKS